MLKRRGLTSLLPVGLLALLVAGTSASAAPLFYDPSPSIDRAEVAPRLRAAIDYLERSDASRAIFEARAALKDSPGSAIAYEVIGAAFMLKQDWKEAERALNEAIRLSPSSSGAQRNLALTHLWQGQVLPAVTELEERIRASGGKDREAKYLLASIYHEAHRPADAERLLGEILSADPSWASAQLLQGIVKFELGKVDAALPLLERVTRRDPASLWGRLALAVVRRAKGRLPASLELLTAVSRERPDWALAHFQLGETLLAQREIDRALQAYAAAERASTEPGGTTLRVARSLIAAGQTDRALAKTEEVLKLGRAEAPARIVRAEAFMAWRTPVQAERELKAAVAAAPTMEAAHLALAAFYQGQRESAKEEAALTRYAKQFPLRADGPSQLGRFYLRQKRHQHALDAFRKAATLAPHAVEPLVGMAEASSLMGQHGEASQTAERVIRLLDGAASGHVLLAAMYERAGNGTAAIASYRKALEREPRSVVLEVGLAELYARQAKPEEAIRLLQHAARAHPASPLPFVSMAQMHERAGDGALAVTAYREVLKRDANHSVALNNLAWLLGKDGTSTREPLRLAERAWEVAPGPLTADTLGWLHYRKGDLPRATALLQQSIAWDADNPSVHYRLGVVLARAGKTGEALEALNRALVSATRFDEADEAERLVAALSAK